MLEREDHGDRVHRRIWELLPWYVNGSLSERERVWVEAHLADCPRCQLEERACRGAAGAVKAAGEVAPSPHPAQFRRLLDRVEEAEREERGHSRGGRLLAPFRELVQATPRYMRSTLVAQAAVILVLVGVLVWDLTSAEPAGPRNLYYTLSAEMPKVNTVHLRMMFSPRATEKEIRGLL
ncbi:MAG: zf-HC2 domain-containing protein, partial [Thermoanaerobaculia bacterium]